MLLLPTLADGTTPPSAKHQNRGGVGGQATTFTVSAYASAERMHVLSSLDSTDFLMYKNTYNAIISV